jgi:transcription antitermination factor NusG
MTKEKNWFALHTKPRAEFKAEKEITDLGIENYLPAVIKIKQWSDRKKKIKEPVLGGYIFVYADEKERVAALETNSVVRCLFENGKPAVIYDWQIENLKRFLDEKADFLINNGIAKGTKIKIKTGPFEGVIGVIVSEQNKKTLTVNLDLLNRSVSAVLPAEVEFEIVKE